MLIALASLLLSLPASILAQGSLSSAAVTTTTTAAAATAATSIPGGKARLEPDDGKIILSAWLDTEDKPEARDRFSAFNNRIGFLAGAFQLSQRIPLAPNPFSPGSFLDANMTLFDEGSNAALFLTVYPYDGFDAITDADVDRLVSQVNNITLSGRNVFIRYGPEMNGAWMQGFGQRPTGYVASFRRIAQQIHDRTTAAMVWAPNLDQNGDSFTAYYPGDEYVDWVGLSVYYKGRRAAYPWIETTLPPPDYFEQIIDGLGGEGSSFSFYKEFAEKRGKPFVLSEGSGCYHVTCRSPGSSSFVPCAAQTTRAANQMGFWNEFLFNQEFRQKYPLFKMANMFEFQKQEEDGGFAIIRDFRTTVDPDTLAQFKSALTEFSTGFQWASPASPTSTAAPTTTSIVTVSTTVSTTLAPTTTTSKPSSALRSVGSMTLSALIAFLALVHL
ncbi:hypothetical protein HDU97_003143 [Phlyctochytrium planicorne]|nr:hypothetical protein HDU97_003143 [Phlyctochytrium planicorne]